jgi:hypothetical protein
MPREKAAAIETMMSARYQHCQTGVVQFVGSTSLKIGVPSVERPAYNPGMMQCVTRLEDG